MAVTIDGVGEINGVVLPTTSFGKVLQVVRATDSTLRSTTSTTYVDVTGMSVTITPQKSDSALLVVASYLGRNSRSANITRAKYQITDSSNNPVSGTQDYSTEISAIGTTALSDQRPMVLIGYATPATTSAVTYKLRFATFSAAATASVNAASTVGQMYAIEVSA